MQTSLRQIRGAVCLLLPLLLSAPGWAAAQPPDRQKKVLVLYAPRRDAQIVVIGDRQLPRILETGVNQSIDYYSEFLEPGRFFQAAYEPALVDFLRVKYVDKHFDVVI